MTGDCAKMSSSRSGAPPWGSWNEAAPLWIGRPIEASSASSVTSLSSDDLRRLLIRLADSDSEFQKCDETTDHFYTPLAILSAHSLVSNSSQLNVDHFNVARDACRTILRHLLTKISIESKPKKTDDCTTPEETNAYTCTMLQVLSCISELCDPEKNLSSPTDLCAMAAHLKAINPSNSTEKGVTEANKSGQAVSQCDKSASQRRIDILSDILTGPLQSFPSSLSLLNSTSQNISPTESAVVLAQPTVTTVTEPIDVPATPAPSQPVIDVKKWLSETCISLLGSLQAGGIILELLANLPSLQRYITKIRTSRETGLSVCQYNCYADASLVNLLISEVNICQIALSLPCFEPLTNSRIILLGDISAAWLLCATIQASSHQKDEDDNFTSTLVEGSLALFNSIGDMFMNSTWAGGFVYKNHLMVGTWILLGGLHQILMGGGSIQQSQQSIGKSPAKISHRSYNICRIIQGMHVLWVALGTRCLEGTKTLLTDARMEAQMHINSDRPDESELPKIAATLDLLQTNTAAQRVARLTICVPLHQMLAVLGVACYRKAAALKRAVITKHDQDADHSDSTVYYQDMIMCSEDSETDDEDSEPLLGLWFESTLVAPDGIDTCTTNVGTENVGSQDIPRISGSGLVPDKTEPYSYINLATEVFTLLNNEVLNCGSYLTNSAYQLQETPISLLSAVIRDLDRETARTDTGTISPCYGTRLGNIYGEFSSVLVRYLYSLTTSPHFIEQRQMILEQLDVLPPAPGDHTGMVPLQIGCRVLKLIGASILIKPIAEREFTILALWNKTINTLVELSLQSQHSSEYEFEDMNVEHAQLLIYLFHSLNLMQKKSVLLSTANSIIKVTYILGIADHKRNTPLAPHQLILITRLLLLLEYIMKYLYDPPPCLLQQIKWNLVLAPGLTPNEMQGSSVVSRMYCAVPHVEQSYRRRTNQENDNFMRPKFYALTNTEINNQETPKLDGLACNFVLGTPDKLKYPLLLDALLDLAGCIDLCDIQPTPPLYSLCAAQYCFQTVWRLLITMPPSTPHLEQAAVGSAVKSDDSKAGSSPLHTLIWAPRANHHKTFSPWLKDTLVKQGMYSQDAENLLSNVSSACDNITYTVWLAIKTIKQLRNNIPEKGLPRLIDVITVDCVLMRLRVSLCDETQVAALAAAHADTQLTNQFIPHLLDLIETLFNHCRDCVAREAAAVNPAANEENPSGTETGTEAAIEAVFQCCGARGAPWLRAQLPQAARTALDKAATAPSCAKQPNAFLNDAIPSESAILQLIMLHCQLMSGNGGAAPALRLLAAGAVDLLATRIFSLLEPGSESEKEKAISLLLPAVVDGRLQFLQETASTALNSLLPTAPKVDQMLQEEVLKNTFPIMVSNLLPANDKILRGMVKCWEKILERPTGRWAFEELFGSDKINLGEVLMMAPNSRQPYCSRVIRLFNKLFSGCESLDNVPSPLCTSICRFIGSSPSNTLIPWLGNICLGAVAPPMAASTPSDSDAATPTVPPATLPAVSSITLSGPSKQESTNEGSNNSSPAPRNGQSDVAQQSESYSWCGGGSDSKDSVVIPILSDSMDNTDNATLLSNLTKHIILHCDETASSNLLKAMVSLVPESLNSSYAGLPLPLLLREAAHLADAHTGEGHKILFPAAMEWLSSCVESLCGEDVIERIDEARRRPQLEASCHLLAYLTDALHAGTGEDVAPTGGLPPLSWDTPADLSLEAEWPDDQQDEEDTSADDSDEDSMLHLKICTFMTTAREYMNQHWYHCHTCKMVDGIGVCTVCALVCHRNHDVSYAKFGNFFCDCGAKEENTCQALVKRSSSQSHLIGKRGIVEGEQAPPPSLRRRPSSPMRAVSPLPVRRPAYASNLSGVRDWIFGYGGWTDCLQALQNLLELLPGPVRAACDRSAPVGRHGRARRALAQLHHGDNRFYVTDQLMVPTLGSQEGAFENVRMSYTGEQGQTIRQLISAHIVRRVAMCCLALPHGRRQHLVVSHEKGKITIYQLSALLKQADSSKRKLTLTRLTSVPIPFTVLSLSGNPWNEDLLAVCGLRECHIITFTVTGSVYERLVLQPGLDTGNFIIRSIWLPGTQTQLALVSADFIKIYDLSKDTVQPQYHFLVPSGKVRDVTFITQENATYMLCMGSAGHIYWQPMNEESHASNGPFYVTNTLEVFHNDIKDVTGQVGGGGVSIYYSHTLKILFFSYAQGKSFLAPLISVEETLRGVSLITIGSASGSQKEGGRSKGAQSLCQWQEVPAHPGLITAVLQASNNPVVLMLKPGSIAIQEIKVIPAKAKITDMVTVRHTAGQELKTTLILLCEDGSLRIYAASPDRTGYWLSPAVAPPFTSPFTERTKRPRLNNRNKPSQSSGKPNGAPTFPIDFFENCIALEDVEFGGNDLLQVYNTAQIKHRLNTNGLFVVSTKLSGFTLEITNPDASTVITGIRVLLGNQDIARTPSFIEVCGRTIQTLGQRNRWYDIPLSREESLQADKKLSVTFSCSQDPEGVIIVDSVKVYGRNKEAFGWPEENEENGACPTNSKNSQEVDNNQSKFWKAAGVERLACALLEVLELALSTDGPGVGTISSRQVTTRLLCMPSPPLLHSRCKALLKSLLGSQYHQHKDQAVINHVIEELIELRQTTDGRNVDPENFFRLLLLVRAIAVSRPLNLVKFAGPLPVIQPNSEENSEPWIESVLAKSSSQHLAPLLANVLWVLACVRQPDTPLALSPIDRCGLRHASHALQALIDVLHAFMMHSDQDDLGNRIYVSLLLSEDQVISFGAKSAIVRVLRPRIKRRRVYIPSPPTTPGASGSVPIAPAMESSNRASTPPPEQPVEAIADHSDSEVGNYGDVDQVVDMSRLLMAEAGGLEALLDIPPDADDETMVELAIALSLQERSTGTSASLAAGSGAPSDTTASAAASDDDETSGVVGAPPVASPADLPTSESGSGVDSIGGTSGRSSTYGETGTRATAESSIVARWAQDTTIGTETAARLRSLRLSLLNLLLAELPKLREIRGHRSIPFMQVLLMLVSALDSNIESDRLALQKFLEIIILELKFNTSEETISAPESRTPFKEMQMLIMRLLNVLMSRKPAGTPTVSSSMPSTSRGPSVIGAGAEWHAAKATAGALLNSGAVEHCRILLKSLLPYWKDQGARLPPDGTTTNTNQFIRPQPPHPLPDMQPFFLRHYVKGHAWDVMENYPHLLTEMALRLPYKIHKHCDPPAPPFSNLWQSLLCEYMMNQQTPFLRKQVRKLLLMICGTKEQYRQVRDVHALTTHMEGVQEFVKTRDLSYDSNVQLMDHLKACVEIVVARTGNWQYLCYVHSPKTLPFLMEAACILEEGVAPTVLQLLQCALCPPIVTGNTGQSKQPVQASNERTERERSADSEASLTISSKFQEQMVPQLVSQILEKVKFDQLRHFIRTFLLETNSTAVRWQGHALLLAIYENSPPAEQIRLVELIWNLWPTLPQYGRKAAQFVDLLGYFSLKTPNVQMEEHLGAAVQLLQSQNDILRSHGNSPIYSALSNYVELDGYYLESEPCLVCNNPEVPMSTIKLSIIRIDSKFTTTTQIVKLVGSHTISHIGLRISDLKRSKMVRAINVFYNNRTVQAVQELKNKPGMWHKAKQVILQLGQTEVRIDFPLPIVACNLMMEYSDFYENPQTSGESLQCPRCSAAVPANPGICANCGENVFQCHRCRAINYDEKDPFLCHACGFCKYAKFDYTLTARPCCAVDTIENDEDRKKMVSSIRTLLDKADRVYRQLVANKPLLESLLHKISEQRTEGSPRGSTDESNSGGSGNSNMQVNRVIQSLAHKYCVDSKNHFDELSKVIQRVLTCRRELVTYDKLQSEKLTDVPPVYTALLQNDTAKNLDADGSKINCYGCALAAASHCLTLLRALASSPEHRQQLCRLGLVQELVQHNLRRGTLQCQEEVRQLICVVTRDNLIATKALCKLLIQRITFGLVGHAAAQDHTNAVRPLVLLLGELVKVQDSIECWEVRLRCIVRLWVWCCPYLSNIFEAKMPIKSGDPAIPSSASLLPSASQDSHTLQQVALPCLQYLHHLMQPSNSSNKEKSATDQTNDATKVPPMSGAVLDLVAWLSRKVSYADWKRVAAPEVVPLESVAPPEIPEIKSNINEAKDKQLAQKYVAHWREKVLRIYGLKKLSLGDGGWLRPVMFNPSSKMARDTACQMVKALCSGYERTKAILVQLTTFLPEIGNAGEASEQFLLLYQGLASEAPWKQFLALRGVLTLLADLLTKEIQNLHKLEETTLTSDLAQGYALKRLTELLAMFLEDSGIRKAYKGRLMGAVLGGYLSLRRLVVQRTRLIDDTQEKLLELLEEMTTGTETETAEFMAVCIETVKKYPLHDFRTPVFIFERLCSIIYPEENDVGEFFLTLEKDPQQEDFLQGRMLGNPYSSLEAGLGPLMRDVKNKICADCELVALLEDDTGMELLVNNKIMSLDLPVKDVYKKVWAVSGEGDAMRVVYRMRGLLGDATEEFVETLSASSVEAVDDEQLYKMANVLADCGGMEVMLERLEAAGGAGGAARSLSRTLLRLLSLCVRARRCVAVLTRPATGSLPALLRALQLVAVEEESHPRPELTCQLLEIMDRILSVAAGESLESFLQFSLTFGGTEFVQALLNCTESPGIRNNPEALSHLTRVLAALVYGNELKMAHLCLHFKQVLDFNKFDAERWAEDEFRMELFCVLCSGIEKNAIGGTLKDYFISLDIVKNALNYITMHAPCVKPTLLRTDSDELQEFIAKPALKYILRFLTGLAADHEPTQMAVCEKVIPIVHRLEQVSSDEHVGSLAENLLEALMSEPEAAKRVQEARDYTRHEKKRLAMAMREKQLGALGMRTNDKGQVTAQCSLSHQVQELGEEAGAVCCICREGYKYQPTKVLGIYTFTKRCGVEEYEVKARKTLGYTTVTHFNVVHVECHMAAVRLARTRDEWESAALQNASTKCNGLLPLWGPHVPESAFAGCLARHNTYLQESTSHRDIGYQCTVHDLKLLLLRFAREKQFHEDTGGGGPLSNMQLVPCLMHMALYVINTTRVAARELTAIQTYLEWNSARKLESAHEAEGPLYYAVLALLLQPPQKWKEERLEHLRRLLIIAQVRSLIPSGPPIRQLEPDQRDPRPYEDFKPYLIFFSLIQLIYDIMFKNVPTTTVEQWPVKLAEAIRHSDESMLRNSERILSTLSEQLLPCTSFAEWCDAAGLLSFIPNPDEFLNSTLNDYLL